MCLQPLSPAGQPLRRRLHRPGRAPARRRFAAARGGDGTGPAGFRRPGRMQRNLYRLPRRQRGRRAAAAGRRRARRRRPLQAEVLHKAFRGAEILYTLKLASGPGAVAGAVAPQPRHRRADRHPPRRRPRDRLQETTRRGSLPLADSLAGRARPFPPVAMARCATWAACWPPAPTSRRRASSTPTGTASSPGVRSEGSRCGGARTRAWCSFPTSSASPARCARPCAQPDLTRSASTATSPPSCAPARDAARRPGRHLDHAGDATPTPPARTRLGALGRNVDRRATVGGLYGMANRSHVLRRVDVLAAQRRLQDCLRPSVALPSRPR
jgi:hypothetical protein